MRYSNTKKTSSQTRLILGAPHGLNVDSIVNGTTIYFDELHGKYCYFHANDKRRVEMKLKARLLIALAAEQAAGIGTL